jgi:cytochrome P450
LTDLKSVPEAVDNLDDQIDPDLKEARSQCPVFKDEAGVFVVTRYDDVVAALTDFKSFSSNVLHLPAPPAEFADRLPLDVMAANLPNLDPPDHTLVRKTLNRPFTVKRMLAQDPAVREIANGLIDEFIDDGRCELMNSFGYRLVSQALPKLMGMPKDEYEYVGALLDDMFSLLLQAGFSGPLEALFDAEEIERRFGEKAEAERYARMADAWDRLSAFLETRKDSQDDDLLTAMLSCVDDEGKPALSKDDIITHMMGFVAAAAETTGNLIGTIVILLDRNPDQHDLLREDPSLIDNLIEEALRRRPLPGRIMRVTTREIEYDDVKIPAGCPVALSVESAAHDDSVFPEPESFDIRRENADRHLTFGRGRHMCLGAPLARVTTKAAIEVLYDRIPSLRVSTDEPIELEPVPTRRMLLSVPVEWDTD